MSNKVAQYTYAGNVYAEQAELADRHAIETPFPAEATRYRKDAERYRAKADHCRRMLEAIQNPLPDSRV